MVKTKEESEKATSEAIKQEVKSNNITEAKLVEVPTQMGIAIQLEDGTTISELELLLRIYNDVQKIKKAV